jgi:hypothetical protein
MKPAPKSNLYQIILCLEDPPCSPSRKIQGIDAETVGVLTAHVVNSTGIGNSPARMLYHHPGINHNVERELQKRFQKTARSFFLDCAREMIDGNATVNSLKMNYLPDSLRTDFAKGTVELLVQSLGGAGKFFEIGEAVKIGAKAYHFEAMHKGMSNYRFASEYNSILKALQGK